MGRVIDSDELPGNSSPVRSSQLGCDPGAPRRQRRRAAGEGYQRPFAEYNLAAWQALLRWREDHPGPLILDSGCGTGDSSLALNQRHPEAWIIAVDKSIARLARRGLGAAAPMLHQQARCCFVLGDLVDLWRLMAAAGWQFERHYLLYPNPWPKPGMRLRRWPLHPVWPDLLRLSAVVEMRSNWEVYAAEFVQGLQLQGWRGRLQRLAWQAQPLSPFEAKYQASGHSLWQVVGSAGSSG